MRGQERRPQFHFFVDRRGLWRDDFRADRRKRRPQSDVAVWALETDGRMDARRRRARLWGPPLIPAPGAQASSAIAATAAAIPSKRWSTSSNAFPAWISRSMS